MAAANKLLVQSYRIAFGSIAVGNPENKGFALETAFRMPPYTVYHPLGQRRVKKNISPRSLA